MLADIYKEEYTLNSFDVVLFGVDDPAYFEDAANEMGVKCVKEDPADTRPIGKKIRSMIHVASQSVSTGNLNNLNLVI